MAQSTPLPLPLEGAAAALSLRAQGPALPGVHDTARGAAAAMADDPGGEALAAPAVAGDIPGAAAIPIGASCVLVRRHPPSAEDICEVRVAVLGNVDAGKSTLLGVLATGGAQLDDGRGRARARLLRHRHEAESGRTSSVGLEMVAFDSAGRPIGVRPGDAMPPHAHKVASFLDLAGHEKYLRTTAAGLTGGLPDAAVLLVSAGQGVVGMCREHVSLAAALALPLIVVVSKTDAAPAEVLSGTLRVLARLLRSPGMRRAPLAVRSADDVAVAAAALRVPSPRVVPIVLASSVTGAGVPHLLSLLHALPVGRSLIGRPASGPEVAVMDAYSVPGVGTVLAGTVVAGTLRHGMAVHVGPAADGSWLPATVRGLQRKRLPVSTARVGQSASLALRGLKRTAVRRGMVVVAARAQCVAVREFDADVSVLLHGTTITPRYQAVVHCGPVRAAARVVSVRQLTDVESGRLYALPIGEGASLNALPMEVSACRNALPNEGGACRNACSVSAGASLNASIDPAGASPGDAVAPADAQLGDGVLRSGDRAVVRFRFVRCAEHVVPGARLLFREGRTKGVGVVTAVYPE